MQIDTAGVYKGYIQDGEVVASKNGFPQFRANFTATEVLEGAQWEAITDEYTMTDFLLLAYKDKNTGAAVASWFVEELQKVYGWEADSYASLNQIDMSQTPIQFVVESDAKYGWTVKKILPADAPPTQRSGLDDDALKDLDKQWAAALKGQKPAKPPEEKKAPDIPDDDIPF